METFGAILFAHEVVGLENIPETGPGLLIYYHAVTPIDFLITNSKIYLYKNRQTKIIADKFLFKMLGLLFLRFKSFVLINIYLKYF